jgi:hypothetical protein
MESLALSHEGVEVGESSESSTKLAQYAINGKSPGGTSPLEDMVDSGEGSDEDGMAIEKLELAYEKVERTAGGATPDPPPQDLAQNDDGEAAGWPVKWYVPELDSDQGDPDEMTTLVRLTESKEMTGVISYIAPDQTTELFDADDEDSDPDDLA